jgi:hypothetical protein
MAIASLPPPPFERFQSLTAMRALIQVRAEAEETKKKLFRFLIPPRPIVVRVAVEITTAIVHVVVPIVVVVVVHVVVHVVHIVIVVVVGIVEKAAAAARARAIAAPHGRAGTGENAKHSVSINQ